jgi:hypothetical protein
MTESQPEPGDLFADPGVTEPERPRRWRRRTVLGAMVAAPAVGAAAAARHWLGEPTDAADPSPPTSATSTTAGPPKGGTSTTAAGPISIADENARPGTSDWQVTQLPMVWDAVRGYASRTSVAAGETFDLFVSTAAKSFEVTAYRIGYYGGLGGRAVWSSGSVPGRVQAPPRTDRDTNMRDAPWDPSVRIQTDATWVPGSYLLKLTSADGGQSQVPIVVRDDSRASAVHIQHDVTTWQAYNLWGGASLYGGQRGRSTAVSFDRPYDNSGSGNFLGGVYEIAALVESLGLDVTYSTSLDTHARPDAVGTHKLWISPAHDEYWSLEMRNGVEAARDAGVNLMFLGANCMFRRIRLMDSPVGPNRHVLNYRVAALDPFHLVDPTRVTTSWREAPAARPESSIVGTYYESNPVAADMVIVNADAWMFAGTGVRNGDRWPMLVGNEYDRVTLEVPTPPSIEVLAHSPVTVRGLRRFSDMTYYTAPSGAAVFSSGSIWFERHLFPTGSPADAPVVAMVTNVLKAFAAGPAAATHPSTPNLAQLGIRPGYLPPIPPNPEARGAPAPVMVGRRRR